MIFINEITDNYIAQFSGIKLALSSGMVKKPIEQIIEIANKGTGRKRKAAQAILKQSAYGLNPETKYGRNQAILAKQSLMNIPESSANDRNYYRKKDKQIIKNTNTNIVDAYKIGKEEFGLSSLDATQYAKEYIKNRNGYDLRYNKALGNVYKLNNLENYDDVKMWKDMSKNEREQYEWMGGKGKNNSVKAIGFPVGGFMQEPIPVTRIKLP